MAKGRFKFDGDRAMRVMKKGSLLAFFNFTDRELGIQFMDWRLINGKNGPFVGPPAREYEKDGERKFSDYIRVADNNKNDDGKEWMEALAKAAYKHFESLVDDDDDEEEEERPRRKAKASAGSKKKRAPIEDDEDEDEDDDSDGFPF